MGVSETAQWAEHAGFVHELATRSSRLGRRVALTHEQAAQTLVVRFIQIKLLLCIQSNFTPRPSALSGYETTGKCEYVPAFIIIIIIYLFFGRKNHCRLIRQVSV